ncbi:WD repeat-containing protein 1 [Ciona intestinalis]
MASMKITSKEVFAGLPQTERAVAYVLGADPKGKNFLYCSGNCVIIRDIENPKNIDLFSGHQKPPSVAKYADTGYYICSGDTSGWIKIWDTTQKEHLVKYEYQVLAGKIRDISWDADSKRIAVCGEGREKYAHVLLWDSGSSVGNLSGIGKSANSVHLKPTRPYRCAVASEDYSTYFYSGPPFKDLTVVEGGQRFANCVRFSPDGKYFAVCSSDAIIYLYDGKTGDLVGKLGEDSPDKHKGGVYSLCFNATGTELLSASADKTAKIWDIESHQVITTFNMGTSVEDQQLGCLWQGDHLLTVGLSGDITYLDRENPDTPLRVISGHKKTIVAVTTNGSDSIFSASFEGRVVKWNAETGDAIKFKGKGHATKVVSMLYDADSNKLITVGLDNNVRFADCDTAEYNNDAIPLESEPTAIRKTKDGKLVVSCQKELVLIKDGNKVSSLPWKVQHPSKMNTFGSTIIAKGKETITSKTVNTFQLYNIESNSITECPEVYKILNEISAIAVSPDEALVAIADVNQLPIYEVTKGFNEPVKQFCGHSNKVAAIAWSPDSQRLCSVSVDCSIMVWDYATGEKRTVQRAHPKSVINDVAWLDNHTVVTVAQDCSVRQWTVSF